MLDVRSEATYEAGHVTKPARCCFNVPLIGRDGALNKRFAAEVAAKVPSKEAKLLLACGDGGELTSAAVELLAGAGYTSVAVLAGGYEAWSKVWSPSGKRRPPPGRWISTGKEALKSGLNIPGVAESYDEGGNQRSARWAQGLAPGQQLPPSSS